ncbi:antibiotic biosynthesis monooxygenase [Pseudoduganella sp. FT25W]|uniref:Antibiotic biosynthesis monooxygenase n=1 Tax=Duganella alba TaxID=2666081 RepID=A0A6L5QPR3_9BURK|nr:antibiotic biosynthesis monooxygenase [Duganella alba]MRX11790.1 antibiotic biosynthesis monooxygenase [Duganella alba]MRX20287.1 antibiotic biosynthesis monooxygenase [Duganella alba]
MIQYALLARFEARPGKEAAVEQLLQQGLALANQEAGTPVWLALKLADRVYGVFDAFHTEAARHAHLGGPIAQALMDNAAELFVRPPTIETIDVLGLKNQPAAG